MPETPPDFPQLLPPLGDELMADDALAQASAQIPEIPDLTEVYEEPQPNAYGMTWLWDFNTNRFVTNGSGPARCWDTDSLRMWCQTAVAVNRGAHPIFSEDFGMDDAYAMIGTVKDDVSAQQQYMEDVAQALIQHDRITSVDEFDFSDLPPDVDPGTTLADITSEGVYCYFEITTDDAQTLAIATDAEDAS